MYRFKTSYSFFVPSFISFKCLTLSTCGRVPNSAHHSFCILLVLLCTFYIPSAVCASSKMNSKSGKILVETNNQLLFSDEQEIAENTVVKKKNDNNNGDENNLPVISGSSQNQPLFYWHLKGEDKKKVGRIKDGRETSSSSSSLLSFFSKTKKAQEQVNSRSWTQWFINNFLPQTNSYKRRAKEGLGKYSKYRLPKLPRSTTHPTTTEFIPDDDEMNTATENPKKKTTPKPDPRDKNRVHLSVRRGPGATYANGSLCPTEYEERFCWSDGSCPWYDTCKTVNCVISCVRRKGEEWLAVKHDSVGIHLRDVKLVEEKPEPNHPPTQGKEKKQVTVEKKNSVTAKVKGANPKPDAKGKDKKKQKEQGKVHEKNQDKPPTLPQKKIKKS